MNLTEKYNEQVPRYTSYPPITSWKDNYEKHQWLEDINHSLEQNEGISLYVHLPYCESLCTYCGCNKHITKNHSAEEPYIRALLQEFDVYLQALKVQPEIKELHLGGGTPTFFSPQNLHFLVNRMLKPTKISPNKSFSFEAHPANTTHEHLEALSEVGFKRISIGVQDVNEEILQVINRFQTLDQLEKVVKNARDLDYESINFDLIYGLPFQKPTNIKETMKVVENLMPERIAFYSYAHVPWNKPSQRAYDETALPSGEAKRALYELGKDHLLSMGYKEIGMDHFSLSHDSLHHAFEEKRLHRNFMGYTDINTSVMIGLGASSISDSGLGYIQNEKRIDAYLEAVQQGSPSVIRSHRLSDLEKMTKAQILDLMCYDKTSLYNPMPDQLERLEEMVKDGMVTLKNGELSITELGKPLLRTICASIDPQFVKMHSNVFSSSI